MGDFLRGLLTGLDMAPIMIMLIVMVLGTFLEWIAIIFITVPIFAPVVVDLGFDPKDAELQDIFVAVLPFIALQAVGLALVLFIPDLAMWLPNLLD